MCTGSLYQETVKHQFDYLCIKSLKGEAANYIKAMDCRQKKEILFSEMTQAQLEELDWEDDYNVYKTSFLKSYSCFLPPYTRAINAPL